MLCNFFIKYVIFTIIFGLYLLFENNLSLSQILSILIMSIVIMLISIYISDVLFDNNDNNNIKQQTTSIIKNKKSKKVKFE